ncbi:hypothetical protein [Catenuloplanes japonicus]|uniref:hypothetical protein n=1 Tax=Catenuloplanes japonicus TaxID=33876 RepID=UPI000523F1BF|nr:hypothetical protein [Catenuloplanes japonicus]
MSTPTIDTNVFHISHNTFRPILVCLADGTRRAGLALGFDVTSTGQRKLYVGDRFSCPAPVDLADVVHVEFCDWTTVAEVRADEQAEAELRAEELQASRVRPVRQPRRKRPSRTVLRHEAIDESAGRRRHRTAGRARIAA